MIKNLIDELTKNQLCLIKDYKDCDGYIRTRVFTDTTMRKLGLTQRGFDVIALALDRYSKEESDIFRKSYEIKSIKTEYRNIEMYSILPYLQRLAYLDRLEEIINYIAMALKAIDNDIAEVSKSDSRRLQAELNDYSNINWDKYVNLGSTVEQNYIDSLANHLVRIREIDYTKKLIEDSRKQEVTDRYIIALVSAIITFGIMYIHYTLK